MTTRTAGGRGSDSFECCPLPAAGGAPESAGRVNRLRHSTKQGRGGGGGGGFMGGGGSYGGLLVNNGVKRMNLDRK